MTKCEIAYFRGYETAEEALTELNREMEKASYYAEKLNYSLNKLKEFNITINLNIEEKNDKKTN